MVFGVQLSTWDGRPTRHTALQPWATDRHGTWYRWITGAATPAVVVLGPEHGGWIARWAREDGVDVHAKVITATATTEHGISAVDLDLHVIRFADRRAAV